MKKITDAGNWDFNGGGLLGLVALCALVVGILYMLHAI
jgi:hypothetical protein